MDIVFLHEKFDQPVNIVSVESNFFVIFSKFLPNYIYELYVSFTENS